MQVLVFSVGMELIGIDVLYVRELLTGKTLLGNGNSDGSRDRHIRYCGKELPVIDFEDYFLFKNKKKKLARNIIVLEKMIKGKIYAAGIICDHLVSVCSEIPVPLNENIFTDDIFLPVRIASMDGAGVLIANIDRFLKPELRIKIKECFQAVS